MASGKILGMNSQGKLVMVDNGQIGHIPLPPLSVLLGTGADGVCDFTPVTGNTPSTVNAYTDLTATANSTTSLLTVTSTANFTVGDEVMIHKTQVGEDFSAPNVATVGTFEFNYVVSKTATTLTLLTPLTQTFASDPTGLKKNNIKSQVLKVFNYTSINMSEVLTAPAWNGYSGGILACRCSGVLSGASHIEMFNKGFWGMTNNAGASRGEGWASRSNYWPTSVGDGGGGGSNGSGAGTGGHNGSGLQLGGGFGGADYGYSVGEVPNHLTFGGGGGSNSSGTPGINSGGAVLMYVKEFGTYSGIIDCSCSGGAHWGGSGGSVHVYSGSVFPSGQTDVTSNVQEVTKGAPGYTHLATI